MSKPPEPMPEIRGPLYIAGPMTGRPNHNFHTFRDAEKFIRAHYPELEIENPIENGGETPGEHPYGFYFKAGMQQLLRCNSIALLPGWVNSRGARAERIVADLIGMQVLTVERINDTFFIWETK